MFTQNSAATAIGNLNGIEIRFISESIRSSQRCAVFAFQCDNREFLDLIKHKTGRYAGQTEGKLKDKTTYTLRKRYGDLEAVSFKMPVHGIFREYGVGNGQPRHGAATKSGKAASAHTYIRRSMSDWFHAPLERNVEALGDLVADYYGDKVLVEFKRLETNTANTASHQGVV